MWCTEHGSANMSKFVSSPDDPNCLPDNRGFGAFCFDKLIEFSERIGQIDAETDESWTYREILLKCIRTAMTMQSMGFESDDIVTLCTYNHSESYLPILAAQFLGLRVASLDPTLALNEMKYLLNMVNPRFIFCVPESTNNIEIAVKEDGLKSTIIEFGESKQYISFNTLLKQQENEDNFRPKIAKDIYDTAFIFFSSGTTGLPKGVCLNHYGLLYNTAILANYYVMDSSLYYTSPYWISHVLCNTITLIAGGYRVICKSFNEKTVIKYVNKYKVTFLFLAPSATYSITANDEYFNYDTSSLKTMMVGGSTITKEQISKLRKLLPHTMVTQSYGLTEISGMITGFSVDTSMNILHAKANSCGKIIAGITCKIVDPETNEIVGPNRRGELLIKAKAQMNGYYEKEEETRRVYDNDGFIRTGDIGYFDDTNYLYIVDRLKEMFKYRSWHIIPAQLESVLLKHPEVKEAVVIGIPHEEDGYLPMAIIVPKELSNITENDVIQFFNEQVINRNKLRGGVKFMKNIPKTSTGKYNKRSLLNIILRQNNVYIKSV